MMAIFWIVFFVVLGLCIIDSWRRNRAARELELELRRKREAYRQMRELNEQNLAKRLSSKL